MVWLSIALVGACAICWDIAIVLQKRAADSLPPLVPGAGLAHTVGRFLRSPQWLAGGAISLLGYGLFTAALTFTPVSVARSIQGLGFVVLAFMSVVFLDHRLRRLEWLGVVAVTGGVVLLGLSEPNVPPPPTVVEPLKLGLGVGLAAAVCVSIWASWRLGFKLIPAAAGVGLSAGTLLGTGDVLTRAVIVSLQAKDGVAVAVLGAVMLTAYLLGTALLSRGYQHGRALVVTGVADFAARVVTLSLGIFSMGEALPAEPLLRAGRLLGFACILGGTVALVTIAQAADFPSKPVQTS